MVTFRAVLLLRQRGCRRREGEVQKWRLLANQARAERQTLQATRDEEAALYAEQVHPVRVSITRHPPASPGPRPQPPLGCLVI